MDSSILGGSYFCVNSCYLKDVLAYVAKIFIRLKRDGMNSILINDA